LCTFKSLNSLKAHTSRVHSKTHEEKPGENEAVKFCCHLCEFTEPCSETEFFTHLRSRHLKVNQKVQCPYAGCRFESSVYSTFNAHKSKAHREDNWKMFKKEIVNVDISDENKESDEQDEQMSTEDTGRWMMSVKKLVR